MYVCFNTPGRGVPSQLERECNRITSIPTQFIPTTENAVEMYHMQGGDLTEFGLFGCDPLKDRPDLIQRRETYFFSTHPSFEDIFSNAVSRDGTIFYESICDFIRVTKSLQ